MKAATVDELLAAARLPVELDDVDFAGDDPVLPTPYPVGRVAAVALGLVAAAASAAWCEAGGPGLGSVHVDVGRAARSLLGVAFQRIDGAVARPLPMDDPFIDLYRCADGRWIHLHALFPHLEQVTLAVLGVDEPEAIGAAVARRGAAELEEAMAAAGGCAAVVRSPTEWLATAQGVAVEPRPVVEVVRIGDAPPEPLALAERPLAGVRLVDSTRVLAGPIAGRTLAEHGAEVLRIGSPARPDTLPESIETGHGKRSATVDLDTPEGTDRLRALLAGADVLCQNHRAGAFEARGLGPRDVAAVRPGIVYASINCYGHEGPWRARRGFEQLAQSAVGLAGPQEGAAEGARPVLVPAGVCDYVTGYLTAYGIVEALRRRATEGGSWLVRASLAQTAGWVARSAPVAGAAGCPDPLADRPPELVRSATSWGELEHLPPVVDSERGRPRWTLPPRPFGADEPVWLESEITRPGGRSDRQSGPASIGRS